MASQQIANHREDTKIFHGEVLCKQKSQDLLAEISLPRGLLPLDDVVEVGYNHTTGFVWLKQKRKKDHRFRSIGHNVSYDTEVTFAGPYHCRSWGCRGLICVLLGGRDLGFCILSHQ
jgi:hypothetical protein|uniref:Uncharacterized protein n=1 Tax=Fagus sylvatica TaxID=28930 RepID=A0A2N9E5T6_FAGSY